MTPETKKPHLLSRSQKETIFLVNIGTFLEYFDFKTYVHIAVVLNAVFFPVLDPYASSLLAAFTFSMAYLVRPIGSFIFGVLGDKLGRKNNILITTMSMSISCFFLGSMPTYEQIGITASIAVIVCRIVQGISSAVEITGASIYITESIKAPRSYFYTGLVGLFAGLGELFALFCCSMLMLLHPEDGWRYVFYLGSAIAIIGMIARTRLKETPEFLEATKVRKKQETKESFVKSLAHYKKNAVAYFLICLLPPFAFFVSFIYMGNLLVEKFGYTPAQILSHNLWITIADLVTYCGILWVVKYYNPLRIMRIGSFLFLLAALAFPFIINYCLTSIWLFYLAQCFIACLNVTAIGTAIFARGFPTLGRYTLMGVGYSLARAVAAVLTSYGCVYVGGKYGIEGVGILLIIMALIRIYGLYTFEPCEEDREVIYSMNSITNKKELSS